MKKIQIEKMEKIEAGFNDAFWNGFCDGLVTGSIAATLLTGQAARVASAVTAGLSAAGCWNGVE